MRYSLYENLAKFHVFFAPLFLSGSACNHSLGSLVLLHTAVPGFASGLMVEAFHKHALSQRASSSVSARVTEPKANPSRHLLFMHKGIQMIDVSHEVGY